MPYSDRMQKNHLYTVFFAPRGMHRMADLGMQIAGQYLSPFDKLIGIVGAPGSGKSMLLRGMFPGLELTNDDNGVNVRPLPLLSAAEDNTGFYSAHTYHVDIQFESAFTQLHELADAIRDAIDLGKRVLVEHFDLIRPFMDRNAHLLIGIGEEIIITRPTLFGPEPEDIAKIVHKSVHYRKMTHTAEDLCEFYIKQQGVAAEYSHSDVRHGFVLSFHDRPDIDLEDMQRFVDEMIAKDVSISFKDDTHIMIGNEEHYCTGPRNHVRSTGEIKKFICSKELMVEPITNRYLIAGVVGKYADQKLSDLNRIELDVEN